MQQQRFVVNHLIQIDIGKGFGIARQHVQAGLRIAQRIVSVVQAFADHAQICVVLLFDGGIRSNGILKAALLHGNIAGNHIGARAFGVGLQSSLHIFLCCIIVAAEEFCLRHFAIKLCDFKLISLFVVRQKLRGGDGFFPVAVLLVNIEQDFVGRLRHIAVLQTQQNLLGPVHQAGVLVVQAQFEQHALAFRAHGVGRIEQGFVHGDGFVVFAALAVKFAERKA